MSEQPHPNSNVAMVLLATFLALAVLAAVAVMVLALTPRQAAPENDRPSAAAPLSAPVGMHSQPAFDVRCHREPELWRDAVDRPA